MIRPCTASDAGTICRIINEAAEKYRGIIPDDCWHDPYMPIDELRSEIAAGVEFLAFEDEGDIQAVMGLQHVRDVDLIRHAYVRIAGQRRGLGSQLMQALEQRSKQPLLVGTWADATWAIAFYQRHGFQLVSPAEKDRLLTTYWTISDRQRATSVVLTRPIVHIGHRPP
jgi:N-acetylglutamate synthase-like GNAT family acetyltransferase